ncbi:MAG TPA: tail fiber domain-containing protein [Pyrinomonadaceae bacterium]
MSAGQQNTTESNNTFVGHFAGASNGTNDTGNVANNNTFVGYNAGLNNTVAGFNTFVGATAGLHNTTAFGNTFFGARTGENNTSGNHNAFFGTQSGFSSLTQHDNTFVGSFAGLLTGGSADTGGNANFNTFVGSNAGQSNEVGTSNTLVGANSDVGGSNLTNASAFGSQALVSANNSLVLGAINGVNQATSDTNVGIGTSTPGFKLHIAGHNTHDWPIIKLQNVDSGGHSYWLYAGAGGNAGDFGIYDETVSAYRLLINGSNGNVGINTAPIDRLDVFGDIRVGAIFGCVRDRLGNIIAGSCGSDARLKRDIRPFPNLLNKVAQLQPVNFFWRTDEFPDRHFGSSESYGLIAQDVEKVLPELVGDDDKGTRLCTTRRSHSSCCKRSRN